MKDFDFKKWNLISGWCVFLIALTTYWLTVEPTASFWDAGEYITTSSNLEVGHPPGAPFYQIMGAFFSLFAFGDVTKIALMVNLMSVFASAFTILFMFWSLTMLLQNIISRTETLDNNKQILILGSAAVGALAFTYTDSFWFSAVETEVYAMASLIMAVLFYLALRWEREMNTPRGNRWVILISLVVGLSFGVHFMGLLTIPAMGLLYYFKNYEKITIKNFILAHFAVVGILLFIFMFMLPMTMRFFSASELFFVNTVGLPFDSGTIIAGLVMIAIFYFAITYTRKRGFLKLNTLMLCFLFIFIGFSSWLMLPIRANAGTIINQNRPSDAQELLAYYNREQYGEQSLLYGPQFSEMYAGIDRNNPYTDDKPNYERDLENNKYVIVNNFKNARMNLDDSHKAFLPRMWSTEHAANYMNLVGGLDFEVKRQFRSQEALMNEVAMFKQRYNRGEIDSEDYHSFLRQFGEYLDIEKPSFGQNVRYMFEYQFGYMYLRYFMWNFAGRQNDIQGRNDIFNGNWISGITFIDNLRENNIGPQTNLPADFKNNKARNTYYFLPLILGLLGLVFHYSKDNKSWWVLMVFFLFTGLALKVYLNERPFEPRERDYALVGSFYVFAMWIGFGVYALFEIIKSYIQPKVAVPLVIGIGLLAAPILLASQNWDDHDRSNRYTATAMAKKYLDSVDPDGIIFTIGDNDTFAIWYAQGVEQYRRDVRPINTSLFNTDWYIDDMKKAAYDSKPIPSQLTHEQYRYGTRDYILKHPQIEADDTISINRWMDWVASDDPRLTVEMQSGQMVQTFPSKNIRIPVDKEAVLRNGIVAEKDAHLIVDYIDIYINNDILYKNRMMMLDIIANNNWERPIYFTGGAFGDEDFLWMKDYLQLDGMAYKLVPIKTPVNRKSPFDMGRIDSQKMYDIVMGWEWGNSGSPDIYHDPETRKNAISYRSNLARLAEQLINEGELKKAENILDLAMENMPVKFYGYYTLLEPYITGYFEVGQDQKAISLYKEVVITYQQRLDYYATFKYSLQQRNFETIMMDVERYRSLVGTLVYGSDEDLLKSEAETFNTYLRKFQHFYASELEDETFEEDNFDDDSIDWDSMDEETLMKMIDSLERILNQ
jgi:hypothetical protein